MKELEDVTAKRQNFKKFIIRRIQGLKNTEKELWAGIKKCSRENKNIFKADFNYFLKSATVEYFTIQSY